MTDANTMEDIRKKMEQLINIGKDAETAGIEALKDTGLNNNTLTEQSKGEFVKKLPENLKNTFVKNDTFIFKLKNAYVKANEAITQLKDAANKTHGNAIVTRQAADETEAAANKTLSEETKNDEQEALNDVQTVPFSEYLTAYETEAAAKKTLSEETNDTQTDPNDTQTATLSTSSTFTESADETLSEDDANDAQDAATKTLSEETKNDEQDALNDPQPATLSTSSTFTESADETLSEDDANNAQDAATKTGADAINKTLETVNYLKTVCSDSQICIAFGTESEKIIKFFDNFSNFSLLSEPLKKIGKVSANGFVKELTYKKEEYVANAILKSSSKPNADNLLYEGLVGFFLNKIGKQFPCFLETYGVYKYIDDAFYKKMRDNKTVDQSEVIGKLKQIVGLNNVSEILNNNDLIKYACDKTSVYLSVMIQFLKGVKTLNDMYENDTFRENHLIEILFQVYMPLAYLTKKFTHYDLHYENVLIYKPVDNGYIEYYYHLEDGIVKFNSPYIAKIIDYGRSFFEDNENNSSMQIKQTIEKICQENNRHGFGYLLKPVNNNNNNNNIYNIFFNRKNNYILPSVYNQSHDLRLLYMLKEKYLNKADMITEDAVLEMYDRIKYDGNFGTQSRDSGYPKSLNNCKDAFKFLRDAMMKQTFIDKNKSDVKESKKIGELHIYADGTAMKFIKAKDDEKSTGGNNSNTNFAQQTKIKLTNKKNSFKFNDTYKKKSKYLGFLKYDFIYQIKNENNNIVEEVKQLVKNVFDLIEQMNVDTIPIDYEYTNNILIKKPYNPPDNNNSVKKYMINMMNNLKIPFFNTKNKYDILYFNTTNFELALNMIGEIDNSDIPKFKYDIDYQKEFDNIQTNINKVKDKLRHINDDFEVENEKQKTIDDVNEGMKNVISETEGIIEKCNNLSKKVNDFDTVVNQIINNVKIIDTFFATYNKKVLFDNFDKTINHIYNTAKLNDAFVKVYNEAYTLIKQVKQIENNNGSYITDEIRNKILNAANKKIDNINYITNNKIYSNTFISLSEIFKNVENVNVDEIINIIMNDQNDDSIIESINKLYKYTDNFTNTTNMDKAKFVGIILAVKCIQRGNFFLDNAINLFNTLFQNYNINDINDIKLNKIKYDKNKDQQIDKLNKCFDKITKISYCKVYITSISASAKEMLTIFKKYFNKNIHNKITKIESNFQLLSQDLNDTFNEKYNSELESYNKYIEKDKTTYIIYSEIDETDQENLINNDTKLKNNTMQDLWLNIMRFRKVIEEAEFNDSNKTKLMNNFFNINKTIENIIKSFDNYLNTWFIIVRYFANISSIYYDYSNIIVNTIVDAPAINNNKDYKENIQYAIEKMINTYEYKEETNIDATKMERTFIDNNYLPDKYKPNINDTNYKSTVSNVLAKIDSLKNVINPFVQNVNEYFSSIGPLKDKINTLDTNSKNLNEKITLVNDTATSFKDLATEFKKEISFKGGAKTRFAYKNQKLGSIRKNKKLRLRNTNTLKRKNLKRRTL